MPTVRFGLKDNPHFELLGVHTLDCVRLCTGFKWTGNGFLMKGVLPETESLAKWLAKLRLLF